MKNCGIYFHNLAKMDFYAEFIFVTGAHQKEIPEMIL